MDDKDKETYSDTSEQRIKRIKENFNFNKPTVKRVHKVLNGDTFIISENYRIKLLGVQTPKVRTEDGKSEYFARKSLSFTNGLIHSKRIKLKFDKEKIDNNGYILAYVYLPDGTFLNAEILKKGYGKLIPRGDFIYIKKFTEFQNFAKDRNLGIWKKFSAPKSQKKHEVKNKRLIRNNLFNKLKFVASKKSKILHYWYCQESDKIAKEDFVIFKTKNEALKEGYKICDICNP